MDTTGSLRPWLVCAAIVVSAYVLIAVVILGEGAEVEAPRRHAEKVNKPEKPISDPDVALKPVMEVEMTKGDPGDPKEAARMVDAIVNPNKPPKLVRRPSGWPETAAVFPEDYDWEEDKRILKALDKLYQDTTIELWEETVRRADDPGYCYVTVTEKKYNATIISVGDICSGLADWRLFDLFEPDLLGMPYSLRLEIGGTNLAKWRKERAGKSLYQLQIEVGEQLLGVLSKSTEFTDKQKEPARKKITATIEQLRSTNQPVVPRMGFFPWRRVFGVYGPKSAEEVRKAVRTGSTEQIIIWE
jgi:hypothetical protein